MLFNSLEFFFFYLAVFVASHGLVLVRAWSAHKLLLLAASYAFYIAWNPPFVLLLIASTAIDFVAAGRIAAATRSGTRRAWLALSIAGNLGLLGYFKYGVFVAENLAWLGAGIPPVPAVILPLGISFYTFQSMSYTIDVYRGAITPHRRAVDFALYVAFFPQLVAGPIVRAAQLLPQFTRPPRVTSAAAERALMLIALGLFKKVVGADVLGEYVDQIFAAPERYPGLNLIVAVYAYAFQIYFDFSGYSDMAVGLAALLGYDIPMNFRLPYAAASPREFWRRWHITLSTWFRDYVYVPLGGNRRGVGRTHLNLAITMLLGGLWHGAAWTFVAWGAYHGLLLLAHRLVDRVRGGKPAVSGLLVRRLVTFHLVCVGWIFFRAESGSDVLRFIMNLVEPGLVTNPAFARAVVWSAAAFVIHLWWADRRSRVAFLRMPPVVQAAAYAAVLLLVFLFSPSTQRFIYFQF